MMYGSPSIRQTRWTSARHPYPLFQYKIKNICIIYPEVFLAFFVLFFAQGFILTLSFSSLDLNHDESCLEYTYCLLKCEVPHRREYMSIILRCGHTFLLFSLYIHEHSVLEFFYNSSLNSQVLSCFFKWFLRLMCGVFLLNIFILKFMFKFF